MAFGAAWRYRIPDILVTFVAVRTVLYNLANVSKNNDGINVVADECSNIGLAQFLNSLVIGVIR